MLKRKTYTVKVSILIIFLILMRMVVFSQEKTNGSIVASFQNYQIDHFQEKVFSIVIPRNVKLSEAPSFGKPAVIYDPQNRGSLAYTELGKEFLVRFGSEDDRRNFISTAQKSAIPVADEKMQSVNVAPIDEQPQTAQMNP